MTDNRQKDWRNQPERGSRFSLKLIAWIAKRLGRGIGRVFLYPICLYFIIFSPTIRRHSKNYLTIIMGREAKWREVYRHFHTFAGVTLDRVFTLTGRFDELEIEVFGADLLHDYIDRGQGCFFIGSHLGGFEILRAVGAGRTDIPISILMYEDNARKIGEAFKSINPKFGQSIINTAKPSALLIAKERIDKGEIVGMLGDRRLGSEKVTQCRFLGGQVLFPQAPMVFASLVSAPVFLVFGLFDGNNRYEIHTELFSENVQLGREKRDEELKTLIGRYAKRLESHCENWPYNWFNFYEFWEKK